MAALPHLSFEFFPPKTPAGRDKLAEVHRELSTLKPEYFSVTYGAGGSTRDNTRDTVLMLHQAGSQVAPHLSFGGDSTEAIVALLQRYHDLGIRRLVALRGDRPSGMGRGQQMVYAAELVALVREHFGRDFTIAVAAYPEIHPEAPSYLEDIGFLKRKFDAGADFAITQYFYNADAYFYFRDACARAGIDAPIVPGIMPITNYKNLCRFSDSCGADIPRWLRWRLENFEDGSAELAQFGVELVGQLCRRLLQGGAPGLHFYSMNQLEPTRQLVRELG